MYKKHDVVLLVCLSKLIIDFFFMFLLPSPSPLLKLRIDLIQTKRKATFQVVFAASEAISLSM